MIGGKNKSLAQLVRSLGPKACSQVIMKNAIHKKNSVYVIPLHEWSYILYFYIAIDIFYISTFVILGFKYFLYHCGTSYSNIH